MLVEDTKKIEIVITKKIYPEKTIINIVIKGKLNSETAKFFSSTVEELLNEEYVYFVINGEKITNIDEAGAGIIVFINNSINIKEGKLFLINFFNISEEIKNFLKEEDLNFVKDNLEILKNLGIEDIESEISETEKFNIFPLLFNCPSCNKKLKVRKEGKYRCVQCKNILSVDKKGNVSLIK